MDAAIRISIDGRGAQTGAQQVNRALDSIGDGTKRVQSSMAGVTSAMSAFKGIMGSIGVAFGVKEAVMLADSYNTLQNRIRSATKASGDYEAVSRRLFATAQENGVSLKSTVATFQSIARGAGELGKSNADIIKFTSTLQKLGSIGGSSAQEMEDGLRQLSQGLSGGIIRAEEWNSIVENTPEIAVRAAKGYEGAGGSIGKLREIMLKGELTAQKFYDAIMKQADGIDKEFKQIPTSVEQAMQALSNSTQKAFGDLDRQLGGGTSMLANAMMGLANNMDLVARSATVLGAVLVGTLVGKGIGALTSAVGMATAGQTALATSMQAGAAAVANNAQATAAGAAASVAAARADQAAAASALQVAQANRAGALAALQVARAQDAGTGSMAKQAAAAKVLQAAQAQLVIAQRAVAVANGTVAATSNVAAVAMGRMTLASRVASVAMRGLSAAMAFFGGPIGAAITGVAAGYAYLSTMAKDSDAANQKMTDGLTRVQDINMELVGASKQRADALKAERAEILKNAEAELAAVRAKEQSESEVSTGRRLLKSPLVGARRLLGWDAEEGEGDVESWKKRREAVEAQVKALRDAASQEIPQLAVPTVTSGTGTSGDATSDLEERARKAQEAAETYKNAVGDIMNETSKMAYMNQQGSGGDKAIEEAGMRYDLMQKAKEAGMYTSAEVENIKQVAAEYRRVSEESENLRQAEEEKNDAIARSDEIWRNSLSPLEEYQIKLAELQDLHQQWIDTNGEVGISQSTLASATAQLRQEINNTGFGEAIDPVTKYKDELQKLLDLHQLFLDSNGEIGLSVEQLANAQTALAESMNSDAQQVFDDTRTSAEKYAMEVERLTQLHQMYIDTNGALGISQDTFNRALEQSAQSAQVAGSGLNRLADEYGNVNKMMENVAMGAAMNLEDSLVDIAMGAKSAKEAFADFARSTAEMLMRTAIQMAIIRPLLMGLGAGFAGGGVMTPSGPMSLPMYAKGGIMSKLGDVPLKTYSSGGVANSPQIAVFGEGRQNEAYVPLPDGRRIPVAMEGGGQGKSSSVSITNHISVNMPQGAKQEDGDRFGQAIARQVEDAMNANLMKQQRPGGLLDPYGYGT